LASDIEAGQWQASANRHLDVSGIVGGKLMGSGQAYDFAAHMHGRQ
jgi:hypothetical protein